MSALGEALLVFGVVVWLITMVHRAVRHFLKGKEYSNEYFPPEHYNCRCYLEKEEQDHERADSG